MKDKKGKIPVAIPLKLCNKSQKADGKCPITEEQKATYQAAEAKDDEDNKPPEKPPEPAAAAAPPPAAAQKPEPPKSRWAK